MKEFIIKVKENKTYFLGFFILIIIVALSEVFIVFYMKYEIKESDEVSNDISITETPFEKEEEIMKVTVEIKGEVAKPGVYEIDYNKRINDVIKLAGGLTKNANTKVNNLSKKVQDEMLIIIYSNKEIENYLKVLEEEKVLNEKCNKDSGTNNSCITITEEKTTNSSKVSLNNATKEELMTLPGIGESKALAILEYRNNKKFETTEEVKQVTGIGENLYAQIKDFITT